MHRIALRRPEGCRWVVIVISACVVVLAAGCAAVPGKRDPHDPWERMNRATYRFNDALDRGVVKPVAKSYQRIVPHPIRTGIANVLDNAGYATTIVNDLLQTKIKACASDTGRFLLNSTVGLAGIFDPASSAGLAKNDEDFGQTLGTWGVHPGPYLVLPLLGPSTVRDTISMYPDSQTDLKSLPQDIWVDIGLFGLSRLGTRVELLSMDETLKNAYDPYAFVRNAYLQHREYEVRDGNVPEEPADEEPVDEENPQSQPTGGSEAPPGSAAP
jgi:phospholipid-binding lipoprotein MlaA